jgi:hypothetical protein
MDCERRGKPNEALASAKTPNRKMNPGQPLETSDSYLDMSYSQSPSFVHRS